MPVLTSERCFRRAGKKGTAKGIPGEWWAVFSRACVCLQGLRPALCALLRWPPCWQGGSMQCCMCLSLWPWDTNTRAAWSREVKVEQEGLLGELKFTITNGAVNENEDVGGCAWGWKSGRLGNEVLVESLRSCLPALLMGSPRPRDSWWLCWGGQPQHVLQAQRVARLCPQSCCRYRRLSEVLMDIFRLYEEGQGLKGPEKFCTYCIFSSVLLRKWRSSSRNY